MTAITRDMNATRRQQNPPLPRRDRTAGATAKPASRKVVGLYLGDEHWVAAAVPAADQMIILANRDRAELSRMVACWQAR
jgi:hypothetical protein